MTHGCFDLVHPRVEQNKRRVIVDATDVGEKPPEWLSCVEAICKWPHDEVVGIWRLEGLTRKTLAESSGSIQAS